MRQRRIKRTKQQVVQEALDQGRSRSLSSRTTAAFPNKGMGHELDGDQREEAGSVKSNHSKIKLKLPLLLYVPVQYCCPNDVSHWLSTAVKL
ncbi:uncharacterized protein LOC144040363 isoform X3 [Vanacampus margaritifer]